VLDEAALQRTAAFLKPQAIEAHLLTIARKAEALLSCLRAPNALAAAGDALVEAAHSLVGSSGMLGFDRLAFVARAFERAVRTGAADVAAVIEDLSAALEATIQEISNRGPAAPNA
jgi:HPt (histidine-containing phosphotransfer) domain-containing protein